jgi:NADH/NAD ratio-sensing transcriptional regulator Rex
MSTLDKVQLLEQRILKATVLIHNLEKKIEEQSDEVAVLSVHNEELQKYADSFMADSKLIEASINNALDQLATIEGLDDIQLADSFAIQDLETADQFTGGAGMPIEEVSLDDLVR